MSKGRRDDSIERYLLRSIQEELEKKWKEAEDKKGISKDARLKIELNKLPSHWSQAICQELGYLERMDKDEQIRHITHILTSKKFLEKLLLELSKSSLFILKYLLSRGGWSTFQTLSRQANTDESGDSWWWVDEPPSSPLGQLRERGLVFVGRTPVKNRFYKIVVIPRELRKILSEILLEVYFLKDAMEKRKRQKKNFLPQEEEDYLELIQEVENCFNKYIDDACMLEQRQIVSFLENLRRKKTPLEEIEQAWEDIQCFIHFTECFSFGKTCLEDFKTWDFSYFVSKFIPREYAEPALTYEEVDRILYNVAEFYKNLKEQGKINSDAQIQQAISCIIRKDGKINKILPPSPKGPEVLLKLDVPREGKCIPFTRNDLWSIIVLCLRYSENWQSIISDLEKKEVSKKITDAKEKKNYLAELKRKIRDSKITPYTLLCCLKPDRREIDRAIRWFYKKKLMWE
ncbi:hypothetical protein IBX65_02530 [Candidatus Aerophobetes bacterium]|nr:hypothetical protein [Candidatus Aerophobetes bacterium]